MKYNRLKWSLLLLAVFVLGMTACSEENEETNEETGKVEEPVFQPSAYNLNLVYFVPSDMKPFENYQRRLSEAVLWIREFYRKEMIRNGFGNRTFGLNMETDKLIKLVFIQGEKPAKGYPYEGGGTTARAEIEKYFEDHPEERTSLHTLVIMPSISKNNMDPGGVPFYGLGTYCFAMDYRYFDLKHLGLPTDEGVLFTNFLGGMAHELGHGLNLPHNSQRVSDEKTLGIALMGTGNMTLGREPTFITEASCAILSTCQVFSPVAKDEFYNYSAAKIRNLKIAFDKDYIHVNGAYNLEYPIIGANVYFDNLPAGPPAGEYDAESWFVKPIGKDSISLAIPIAELHRPRKDFAIRILFIYENGSTYSRMIEFKYKDGKVDDFEYKFN